MKKFNWLLFLVLVCLYVIIHVAVDLILKTKLPSDYMSLVVMKSVARFIAFTIGVWAGQKILWNIA